MVESPTRSNEQGILMYSHCSLARVLAIKACKPLGVFQWYLDSRTLTQAGFYWRKWKMVWKGKWKWKMAFIDELGIDERKCMVNEEELLLWKMDMEMSCVIDVQLMGFKIFSEREVEGNGCGDGFVLRIFHEFSLWKTNCRHNVVSVMIALSSCNL